MDAATLGMLKDYVRRGGPVSQNGKLLIFGINRHRAWQVVRDCGDSLACCGLLLGVVAVLFGPLKGNYESSQVICADGRDILITAEEFSEVADA